MKRDMNIVRDLLLFYESDGLTKYPTADADAVGEHVVLMHQAGFIVGNLSDGPTMLFPSDGRAVASQGDEQAYLFPITWAGHDFLAAARDQQLWNRAMSVASGMTVATIKAYLQKLAHEHLGLSD